MSESSIEADVVVVGSDVSGLAAALEAAQGGASVTVFEKQPSFGGTSNFFKGISTVGSCTDLNSRTAQNQHYPELDQRVEATGANEAI